MPKQTFYNLPEHKRKTIELAALDEFSEYGFDASNMNRIVENSRIAKGSFYQYFEDKKDLYFYLIDTLFTKKMKAVDPVLDNYREHGFSHNLKELFCLGLSFYDGDPKLNRLGEDFSTMQRPFVEEFTAKHKPEAADIYLSLLMHAQEKGELCADLDIQLVSTFIAMLINQTTIYLMGRPNMEGERDAVILQLLSFIDRAVLKQRE